VDADEIQEANAYLNTSRSAAKIVGPAAAGILAATVGGGWGIALDALSFFIAAALLAHVETPSHAAASHDSLIRTMRAGWTYFARRPWIWSITAAFALMNPVQMGAWRVLGPVIAERTFGAAGWGLTLSVQAVGLLVAGIVMLRAHVRRPLTAAMAAVAAVGLPMLALGQRLGLPYLMAAALLAGAGSGVSGIAWNTALQRGVAPDKMSRVMAFDDFGSFVTIPLGLVLAIPTANRWGFNAVETTGGVLWIIVALAPLLLGAVRRMTVGDMAAQALDEPGAPPA
jgi:hypothetical protein